FGLDSNSPLRIGTGPSDHFHGRMADLRLYSRVLQPDEIRRTAHRRISAFSPTSGGDNVTRDDPFARENLVAWCIVPFDSRQRSPAERAAMVKRLGLNRVAYDWREEHVATFE